ncbi:hypothetical protein [Paraburkholderia fungorum]|uniref:hypothetical protein n=1 Tax=Paraburkholderia fungorum TaxID=134537 RepID=UPI0038BD44DC
MKLLVLDVEPDRERMVSRAGEDFSTATDLADLLVRRAGTSFRDAHHIIGSVVRDTLDQGLSASNITSAMIDACASEQLGRDISLKEEEVRECLDPVRDVAARQSYGGPAPRLVLARIEVQEANLLKQRQAFEATSKCLSDAETLLNTRVEALVSRQKSPQARSTTA